MRENAKNLDRWLHVDPPASPRKTLAIASVVVVIVLIVIALSVIFLGSGNRFSIKTGISDIIEKLIIVSKGC